MEIKFAILKHFFDNPESKFGIRELARLSKINHTTTRTHLNKLLKKDILVISTGKPFPTYSAKTDSQQYLNLKLFYNLEKIRKSKLIQDLEISFEYPAIVLFGSYAKAIDDTNSDIDICIISNKSKEINTKKYENQIERKISLHNFTKSSWKNTIKKNPWLANNICNGIVLAGQLEVME